MVEMEQVVGHKPLQNELFFVFFWLQIGAG